MPLPGLPDVTLSTSAMKLLEAAPKVTFFGSAQELYEAAVPEDQTDAQGYFTVGYDVPGKGFVEELKICKVRNGISANYVEAYMRRRDPECMCIADDRQTDKARFADRWGDQVGSFDDLRQETFDWLKTQELGVFFFESGMPGEGLNAVAIVPANAAFFGFGLSLLQGIKPLEEVRAAGKDYHHGAIVYVAPPFRHSHFDGKQVVVHNRRFDEPDAKPGDAAHLNNLHELFSFNLYPGPSAKKGVYGMLLTAGERDANRWTTAHCATVQVVTPYDNTVTIMHEGASGGGKSEMIEQMHREADGRLRKGTNTLTGEKRYVTLPHGCELHAVTDDMALCHPSLQVDDDDQRAARKVTLVDGEQAWFLRVNHIDKYGTDPQLERITAEPTDPLLFLNIDAVPNSRAMIWEHILDDPKKGIPCPNPRVVLPRLQYPNVVSKPVTVDIRSFGVRCPPCTAEHPTYGIIGLFHVLPPALAWLWRLVAPRGHGNPSIVDTGGMTSEGVGSYWPFATGRRVDQANILLDQVMHTTDTLFVLIPNQHIGCWEVGFAPQWIAREYLARRGGAQFDQDKLKVARSPLLGRHPDKISVEGQIVGTWFFDVASQAEVGPAGYDKGAEILYGFFRNQLENFEHDELDPLGKEIIAACLDNATIDQYEAFTGRQPVGSPEPALV
ncbi:MAG: DUF4914 family protein [Planctomycetota bacterium]